MSHLPKGIAMIIYLKLIRQYYTTIPDDEECLSLIRLKELYYGRGCNIYPLGKPERWK